MQQPIRQHQEEYKTEKCNYAVVYSKLVFNSSTPVPSESLVLNATNTLLISRHANLSNSTQVLNVTYEKITETSYAVIFTISVSNISMPESAVLMNNTYNQLKNSVNIALNTLLNEPSADLFEPQRSDFRTSGNQVEGNVAYSFQEGDAKTPISFLNELKTQSVVYSRLVFNSSTPVPSESLVLNATNTLLISRRANLSNSTQVLNVTYEKITETSYAVIFTISVSNISMPESAVLMNNTYTQLKNSVNIALNTLLNEPSADLFEPQRSDFRTSGNQVEGNVAYSFQEGDAKTPISFLNELKTQSVVYSRLVFNSSTPVPSESLVLNATNTLLISRRANLSNSTQVLNVTYEKITETSYAVIFTISVSNISMPESAVLMNDTYTQLKNSVNIALNTLLNEPSADLFEPQRSDFRTSGNQVEGNVKYSFQEGDAKTPISFLNELKTQSVVYSRLVFNSSTPVPSESLVLNATNTLLISRHANLSNSTQVLNVTYEKITETSYAVIFTISVSNISMPESAVLMNDTYTQLKNSVNIALNTLLNEPSADLFEPQRSDFRTSGNQVEGNVAYSFQEGDAKTPISFLNELKTQSVVYSRLVFNSSTPVPSESLVLNATNTLLISRRANLSNSTQVLNVTYEKITETSYAVIFTISVSNISIPESAVLMNDTYTQLKNSVNIALNTLLNEPSADLFEPQRSDFRTSGNQVEGNVAYSFQEGDAKTPISFLNELKTQSVVYSRLVFNSSTPVPSESLVLNATNTLLISRRANLSNSTQVLNVTYEKITETSYAVIFTISVSNISMPESAVLMNDTYTQLKNSVNIALNTLLNEPSADLFEPQRSDFRTSGNQVEGNVAYSFQEGDAKTPISFLNELKTQSVVYSRLVFNSSTPVPSESLVLNATNTLLISRRANLSNSTQVLNVTYEKITETSYAVIFTISVSNISMPESAVLMNDTYTQLKNSVNIALNTLLNEPSADLFEPQRSDFRTSGNQVEGNVKYSFQEGDAKTPISFLNELKTQSVVYSRLVFNSSTPVPSESLVLNATNTLLISRRANLSNSTQVLNVTYEKITETSYAVIFTISVSNISIPESAVLMNDTYTQLKNSVNIALNTLLNEPSADLFEPQRSDFRTSGNQVEGNVKYSFQEGDAKTPISFLNELKTQSVVYSRLVFNSSTPVPSESLVLNATNTLLISRRANLSNSTQVLNVTYEKITETSYAVIFTISVSNISMPESAVLMNDTYTQLKDSVNIALNTLLNEPSADLFEPQRSDFRTSGNQVEGNVKYSFQEGDAKTPISFLNELKTQSVVYSRLVFNSSTPVPSESLVLNATNTLLISRRANLSNSTQVLNVTYEKITETSYAVIFTISVSNISIPESAVLMNDTYTQLKNSVNIALNTLLNEPSADLFEPQRSDFRTSGNQVEGNVKYSFQEGDAKTPISFLNELKTQSVVYSRLVFNSSTPVPSESLVLNATNTLLISRRANLSNSTQVLNVTYEKITETSYAVIFTISVSNISMPESAVLMNDTYTQLKNSVNIALNTLLNEPSADLFEPQRSDFRTSGNQVEGNVAYSFQEGDAKTPISFLNELKTQSVVYSRLVFNSSTPVPSESLVLNATNTLLISRRANLSNSTQVLNVTYEKITETSYAVIFTISVSNISMPESAVLMNDTYTQLKNSVNIALNTLLNEPSADLFEPQRSDFRTSGNQVEGNVAYSFQEGDAKTPISFLNELKTQSVVYSRLVFNSSTPVPSESLVLNATNTLLISRRANLSNSTQVLNVTYEKITETSYAVIFTISVSNISMPESAVLMNDTYTQLKDSVNIALNTLLNEPSADLFEPQRSDFRTSGNQVEGNVAYSFQEGDAKTPISFLNELKTQSVVYSRLVFNSSTPVPSESLVLNATNTLLISRRANLSNSTQVLNVTYEKITETSYAVIFTISVSNISMPESAFLMNDTYTQLKNSVNIALNTLLNEPSADLFEPQRSDFRTSGNQVEGNVAYSFQEGDAKTPISFLNELKTQSVVYSRLVFNSSTPVPSESLVLNATNTLLISRRANLSNSTQVLNVTYEKITETSYAVIFTISVSNISIPESAVLMNDTYTQLKNSVNIALNTLLNEPSADLFEPQRSDFRTSGNQVEGNVAYSFQEGDAKTPISFLNELKTQSVVYSRLVFNSSTPVPSESLVLNATNTLLISRRANLSNSTQVLNVTYEKITETSYAVIFTISVSNISMPESAVLMNDTYTQLKDSVNIALNTLLNEPSADLFEPQRSDFRMLTNQVEGNMDYSFQEGDTRTPSSFLNEIKTQSGSTPTMPPIASTALQSTKVPTPEILTTSVLDKTTSTIIKITTSPTLEIMTAPPQQITAAPTLMGTVLIYIRLVFKNLTTLPSEAEVLNAANALLDSSVRMKRDVSTQKLNNPVSIQNVTYQKTSSNSYSISFAFKISNVNISKSIELRNETYDAIQKTINGLLNKILNDPNATPFVFQRANYTGNDTVIQADAEYVFVEGDIKTPSGFLKEILNISGLAGGGFPGWALAIIIPCGIAIILVPCWIILCIMLSGCCGAVRRRWHRRRSYNVQYPIHNSLF
ncbi:hypothetical protein AOLI_G00018610 [Acnodon oligacanthus]